MRIAILGFDRQGRSALDYWATPENTITVCDKNPDVQVPEGYDTQLGSDYLKNLDQFDLLIRTPGLHPHEIQDANSENPHILEKVTTVTNEFLRVCPTKNIAGVTGTKGKGTTSTLLTNILESAGKRVHLGGNIGIAPLELLKNDIQSEDWVVLELANYQLIDLAYSPPFAICLMIAPEHLDWHASLDEYLRAKQQLFAHQTEHDIAVYNGKDNRSMHLAITSLGTHIPYLEKPGAYVADGSIIIDEAPICTTEDVPLLGVHNLENVCAAVTCAWQITKDTQAIAAGIKRTKSLPHRLQYVEEIKNVAFYNDSFGTTPETAIAAVHAMTKPTVLILGGSDKRAQYDSLAKEIANSSVSSVVLIGQTAPQIRDALESAGFTEVHEGGATMDDIVQTAYELAGPEAAVVLSPACASFDMFKNYEDRGEQFIQAVRALAGAER